MGENSNVEMVTVSLKNFNAMVKMIVEMAAMNVDVVRRFFFLFSLDCKQYELVLFIGWVAVRIDA